MGDMVFIPKEAVVVNDGSWVRNPNWLTMPVINAGDNKFAGLYAIYELEHNSLTIYTTGGTQGADIDWGDGTTAVMPNGGDAQHTYNYATLSGAILVDNYGANYKQAMVEIDFYGHTQLRISRLDNSSFYNGVTQWLDCLVDLSTMTTFLIAGAKESSTFVERLIILNNAMVSMNYLWYYMRSLRVLGFDFSNATALTGTMFYSGDFSAPLNVPLSITNNIVTSFFSLFYLSSRVQFGDFSSTSGTDCSQMFFSNFDMRVCGSINVPAATTLAKLFNQCVRLKTIGTITTGAVLTNISNLCNVCFLLEGVNITNCSGITNTTNAFLNATSLKSLILTGLTVGFTANLNNMEAPALNALFTSLGTASGVQTVTVNGCPGSATCDQTIATLKGWTVVV